jgi:hypothetical protein
MSVSFAGVAPSPQLLTGGNGVTATAPSPQLITGGWGFVGVAPSPALYTASIEFRGAAPPPSLVAQVLSGTSITFVGAAPVPRLSAQILVGNALTFVGVAPSPTLSAFGYGEYRLSFEGAAPSPQLVASMLAAASANYRTWCMNLRRGALTSYGPEFAFESYTVFQGRVLAVNASGLVVLGLQDLDGAAPISAKITTGKSNFESSFLKRVPRQYINYTTNGDMIFGSTTTEGGTRKYALPFNSVTGLQTRRIQIGKGPKSVHFQFSLENVNGSDFDLSALLTYPVQLRRRVQ